MPSDSVAVRELPRDVNAYLDANEKLIITVDTRLVVAGIRFQNSTGRELTVVTDLPPAFALTEIPNGITTRGFPMGVYRIELTADSQAGGGPVSVHLSALELADTSSEFEVGSEVQFEDSLTFTATAAGTNVTQTFTGYQGTYRFRMTKWRLQVAAAVHDGGGNGSTRFDSSIVSGFSLAMAHTFWFRYNAVGSLPPAQFWDTGMVPLVAGGFVTEQDLDLSCTINTLGTAPSHFRADVTAQVYGILEPLG